MYPRSRPHQRLHLALAATVALVLALHIPLSAQATTLIRLSTDPYTNSTSMHATQVEPDTFSNGSTIVSAFQSGRFKNGGSSNIGWATSQDGGTTWTHGFLPGITVYATPAGSYARVSDPSVAYDAKAHVWLVASLPLNNAPTGLAVVVNRSADGVTWSLPVTVTRATRNQNLDKDWIVCDNHNASPFYGNCYVEFDDNGAGDLEHMVTSSDGGLTWGPVKNTGNNASGFAGQPLVQPNGNVIVPLADGFDSNILAFTSSNGGASWSSTVTVSPIHHHAPAGNLRADALPSAEIDASGRVYLVWADCRFETSCTANDIVATSSTDGTTWTRVRRVPIDPLGSGIDHNIPGLAVDPSTTGSTTHLGLTYYYYPNAACTTATCQLDVGYVQSTDQGRTWTTPVQVAGPMTLTWLPLTTQGYMVGDYISTSFVGGKAYPVIASANANSSTVFDEAMYAPAGGLATADGTTATLDEPEIAVGTDHTIVAPATAR